MAGAVVNTWSAKFSRNPFAYNQDLPPLSPLVIGVGNTAGNWLFATVSWRQDGGTTGQLNYPSTINVSDDAGNFWIPVQTGKPSTGIVRSAVWMAPAARAASLVFVSPAPTGAGNAYQAALAALVVEVTAACPWYQVTASVFSSANQTTAVSAALPVQGYGAGAGGAGGSAAAGANAGQTGGGGGGGASNNVGGNGSAGEIAIIIPRQPDQILTAGSGTWVNTFGVTSIRVLCWGGGAGGDDGADSGGGGGGEFAEEPALAVTPGHSYAWTVGGGGLGATVVLGGGGNGTNTLFAGDVVTVTAHGGLGGVGGTGGNGGTGSGNTIHNNGGRGGNGSGPSTGGGGGGSGGETGAGGNGGAPTAGIAGAGVFSQWFSLGVMAYDNTAMPVTTSLTNAVALPTVTVSNGSNHSGDLSMYTAYGNATGTSVAMQMFRNSGGQVADLAAVMITVQGASNPVPFTYPMPLTNWPVLITEMAAGPALNLNPDITQGTFDWNVQNGTLTAVNWPVFQPYPNYQPLITQSLRLVPSGSATQADTFSGLQPVSQSVQYAGLAWAYSPTGYSGNVTVRIGWYDATQSFITTSSGTIVSPFPAGAWVPLTFPTGVWPPQGAVYGVATVIEYSNGGNVPSSAVLFIGYNSFGPTDAYENVVQDQFTWSDLSSRQFTQDGISITRGIQYEQQSLEAGTMRLTLANNDGAIMFGNALSPYFPNMGDTDVPIRLRAIWPLSVTPYYVLFSGFTDDIKFGWDTQTWFGYASIESSDGWSRLTAQMIGAAAEEVLLDAPVAYISCNGSGANQVPNGLGAAQTYTGISGAGGAVASFTSSAISLAGDQGISCWQSTGTPNVIFDFEGVALGFFPAVPYSTAGGMTLEFWMSPQSASAAQPTSSVLTVCSAFTAKGLAWTITINNLSGPSSTRAVLTYFDQATGVGTSSSAFGPNFLNTTGAAGDWFFCVNWTQTSLSLVLNPGGGNQATVGPFTVNFGPAIVGFTWGGNAGPTVSGGGANGGFANVGFMNIAIYGIAVFSYIVPGARLNAHFQTALSANPLEVDVWRLARIASYAGAAPVILGMDGLNLAPSALAADNDLVTAATDTSSQVASDYFTNVAASTLAYMFVNGPGTLIYRRRLEIYDRALSGAAFTNNAYGSGTWAIGDNPSTTLVPQPPAGWSTANGATLTSGSLTPVSALFGQAGVFHGNGSTAGPQVVFFNSGAGVPVTAGQWYSLSCVIASPQGWTTGAFVQCQFYTAGGTFISSATSTTTPLAANSLTLLQVTNGSVTGGGAAGLYFRAPRLAARALIAAEAAGTPASSVLFYVADVQFQLVPAALTSAPYGTAPEAPYLSDVEIGSDRALLFNQAVLTQYGTNLTAKFTGTNVTFVPSSGVVVTITNQASVNLRSEIPYTASVYLDNTSQALPYYINEPSIEDFGNWITQTLSQPLLRPDKVTITPAATPQSMLMALGAEVGDAVTFRRRPFGSPEIQIITYISKITHDIDIASGRWTTTYELSPYQQGTVLACDDPAHGTLTGGNYLGW